jgi:hypothetical protein
VSNRIERVLHALGEGNVEYLVAYARRMSVPLGATTASVVSLGDRLALKREAGRSQDLADIEALEALSEADP